MAQALWIVDFIDWARGSDYVLASYAPENLHFTLNIDEPHTINAEMSVYDGAASLFKGDAPAAGPYQTDFRLRRGSLEIMRGIVTRTGGAATDEFFSWGGQSYLHYLDRRVFPCDMTYSSFSSDPMRIWAAGQYIAIETPVKTILTDILTYMRDVDSYGLDFTMNIDDIPNTPLIYQIETADSETMLSKVKTLSEAMYGSGSFDFEMTRGKVFRCYAPEKGDPTNYKLYVYKRLDGTSQASNLEYANSGPIATHVIGTASGGALPINKDFPNSSAKYRRLDKVQDFGQDVVWSDQLDNFTSSELSLDAFPAHDIPLTVNPDEWTNFWSMMRDGAGHYIYIRYDMGWHKIDSSQKVLSMDCAVSTEGDESVSFSLNQWHDRSSAAGYDNP